MHIKKRKLLIKILSIIVFILGFLAVFVWGLNTVSQNKAITAPFIKFQINRLLDLESEVDNPRAYLDWDLQYKIRADKLTFINDKKDLVSAENLQLNVFVPYLLFRKIYITQMNANNLYVDFERYKNSKLNIIEIFNITGFFKVYFRNSSISVDKYFFNYTDNYHSPSEKMIVTGNSILLSKFTLKKYMNLIIDGKISYNKKDTPFYISYDAKIPTIKNDYNFEINLPDIDTSIFRTYISEFNPKLQIDVKGRVHAISGKGKFFNIDTTLNKVKVSSPDMPLSFDFEETVNIKSKGMYDNNQITLDELAIKGKNFSGSVYGKFKDYKITPDMDLHLTVDKNSNANSMLKIMPFGIPGLNHAVDKMKKYNIGAIVSTNLHIQGKPGDVRLNGKLTVDRANLGYGCDLPDSSAIITFEDEIMHMSAAHYPTYSEKEFVSVNGNIKINKPVILDLNITSPDNMHLVPVQKAINIYSDILNFTIGPVKMMTIQNGLGRINLKVHGTPPNVQLNGKMVFWNGKSGYPGLSGVLDNIYGEVNFDGAEINYNNIKGVKDGVRAYAHGTTEIHKNGLTHFYLDIPDAPLKQAQEFINNSPMLVKISKGLELLQNPSGYGSMSLMTVSDKQSMTEPYCEGTVNVHDSSCDIRGLAYRANNVSGKVHFNNQIAYINMDGILNGINANLNGTVSRDYSDIIIATPNADLHSAYEFLHNSPMFEKMKNSFDDFSDFSGNIKTSTRLKGNLTKDIPDFDTNVEILGAELKYLDIPQKITIKNGKINANPNTVSIEKINGELYSTPFKISGNVKNIGLPNENTNLKFEMNGFEIQNFEELSKTKLFKDNQQNDELNKFNYTNGLVDIISFINKKEAKTAIKFHDAYVFYKPSKQSLNVKSGEFFYSNNIIRMNDIFVQMPESDFSVNGDIENYPNNPDFNLNITSNVSADDFNKTIAPMFHIPMTLVGTLYSNINFTGDMQNWHLKTRLMVDDNSYVLYRGANLGEGLSKFIFLDIETRNGDLIINTLDVLSPNFDNSDAQPDIMAQIYGKVKNVYSQTPEIENLEVKFNDYMNISFLNLLLQDPNKTKPLLQDGKIKGSVVLNGKPDDLIILGKANVQNAIIPSVSTTVKDMDIEFKNDVIDIKNALVNIAGFDADVKAEFENKFVTPVKVKKLILKSDFVDTDKIFTTFLKLFAEDEQSNQPAKNPVIPIIVDDAHADIKSFTYNGISSQDFSADFKIADNWLCEIDNISAILKDGSFRGDIKYNFRTTDFSGNLEIKNLVANDLATSFLNLPNEIYGKIDGNVKFSTKGKNHDEMVKYLNAFATFTLNKGHMIRLGSVEYMLRIANILKGGITRINLNAIVNIVAPRTGYFDIIEGDIQIKNGIIYTNKIVSYSHELNLFMTGVYNMNNANVNAMIVGQMPKESKESVLWLGPIGKISLRSVVRQFTRDVKKDEGMAAFSIQPKAYFEGIPGLQVHKDKRNYRFFVVTLKGNLYEDNYVDEFKWIK